MDDPRLSIRISQNEASRREKSAHLVLRQYEEFQSVFVKALFQK